MHQLNEIFHTNKIDSFRGNTMKLLEMTRYKIKISIAI